MAYNRQGYDHSQGYDQQWNIYQAQIQNTDQQTNIYINGNNNYVNTNQYSAQNQGPGPNSDFNPPNLGCCPNCWASSSNNGRSRSVMNIGFVQTVRSVGGIDDRC